MRANGRTGSANLAEKKARDVITTNENLAQRKNSLRRRPDLRNTAHDKRLIVSEVEPAPGSRLQGSKNERGADGYQGQYLSSSDTDVKSDSQLILKCPECRKAPRWVNPNPQGQELIVRELSPGKGRRNSPSGCYRRLMWRDGRANQSDLCRGTFGQPQ